MKNIFNFTKKLPDLSKPMTVEEKKQFKKWCIKNPNKCLELQQLYKFSSDSKLGKYHWSSRKNISGGRYKKIKKRSKRRTKKRSTRKKSSCNCRH